MKKLIGFGIAAMMVMGLGVAANASSTAWTMFLKAGVLNGTTWSYSQAGTGATSFGIAATAVTPGYYASLSSNSAGIYGVDPNAAKMANKDIRAFARTTAVQEVVWNLKLSTGSGWNSANKCTVAWAIPNSTADPNYPADAFDNWTIKIYRGDVLQSTYAGTAYNSYVGANIIGTYTLDAGVTEDWKIVATVPEPGSMLAMLSGLVGLAGFGIRRRK